LFDVRVDAIVGQYRFDVVRWELAAAPPKARDVLFPPDRNLAPEQGQERVLAYWEGVRRAKRLRGALERLYAEHGQEGPPEGQVQALRAEMARLEAQQAQERPLVEAILARQVASVLKDLGLTTLGQVWPPVAFRLTASPLHLTISPREVIRVKSARDLRPDIPLEVQVALEEQIDGTLGVSSLIEATGGYGAYPSMILETPDLPWTLEVVAHEWTHNYLAFRPLGWQYFQSPEMRSINVTVADIVGEDVGRAVLERYYPDQVPAPPAPEGGRPAGPPAFDFAREMRITRMEVDRLLAEGKVEEAEAYMEARRQEFVRHGYFLRKLNQAYFAFHGTYTTGPAASAVDPVGHGLTRLRGQVGSLREFLSLVEGLRSYGDFLRLMEARGIPLPTP
ncbi:MAG: hypothetical protein H5T59_13875, partial [Anaerolineae bacterium]|nr:hypothetical protein [Anaerolineae bacterium]